MKTILITGVSSGIGYALAQDLQSDHQIIGVSRRDPELKGISRQQCDLGDDVGLKNFLKKNENMKVDVVVCNAGVGFFDHFEKISDQEIEQMVFVNLLAPIKLLHALLPKMNQGGQVIIVGSRASRKFMKFGAVYQATKFGLRGLAGALQNEYPKIEFYFLNPKIVDTAFHLNSKVQMDSSFGKTELTVIVSQVRNILDGAEEGFEIDL